MKKNRFLSFLSGILLIAGVFLLLLPRITAWVIERRAAENAAQVEMMDSDDLQANLARDSIFDFDDINEIDPSSILSGNVDPSLIIGRLYIPSIRMNLTVYNGVTNDILNAGAGTMRPNLAMGEGNFPIAGHYSSHKNTLFSDLSSIEIGDLIFLTDNEYVYEYKTYDTKIVHQSEVKWIDDQIAEEHGTPVISLMNCYYDENGTRYGDQRYFVFGELVEVYDADEMLTK